MANKTPPSKSKRTTIKVSQYARVYLRVISATEQRTLIGVVDGMVEEYLKNGDNLKKVVKK